ncbi:MAG: site-2 protease family protein [Anaerosomatales bacterium]|nr:site-2 protease family protein [Anaerosomatales bacterium]
MSLSGLDAVFWGIVTFSILVVLHEGGHFLVARAFGVKVHEFMIGLPGPALRIRGKKTTYGITAVPFGGYVRIAGMEPGEEDPLLADAIAVVKERGSITVSELGRALGVDRERASDIVSVLEDWGALVKSDDHSLALAEGLDPRTPAPELLSSVRAHTYRGLSTPKRIAVLSAGVVANILAAILVFTFVLAAFGTYEPSLTLEQVQPGSPAAAAGLRANDTLVALDGKRLETWEEFQQAVASSKPGQEVRVDFERDGVRQSTTVTLGEANGHGFVGVRVGLTKVRYSVWKAFSQSLVWTGLVFKAIVGFFRPDTFGESVRNARSVVGISVMAADAAKAGPLDYAWLVALLSLSLGAMNVMPIPPLDGGKIAFEVLQRVTGRSFGRRLTTAVTVAGAALLFSLIGYLVYSDIIRLAG